MNKRKIERRLERKTLDFRKENVLLGGRKSGDVGFCSDGSGWNFDWLSNCRFCTDEVGVECG